MKRLIIASMAVLALAACKRVDRPLPVGTDNVPAGPNWERIANVPYGHMQDGVYKVVDTEDSVICYYIMDGVRPTAPSCLAYYHEGSNENYRQVE